MNTNRNGRVAGVSALSLLIGLTAEAATFHYDPATGMVALDTASSPSGTLGVYQWELTSGPIRFRNENFIRLSNSPFFFNEPDMISDRSDAQPFDGYYALGEVLPSGLDESTWTTLFNTRSDIYTSNLFSDPRFFGGPVFSSYGLQHGRDYDNATSLLDLESIQWAEQATITYQPADGSLELDTSGPRSGYISSFSLESDNPIFVSEAYQSPVDQAFLSLATANLLTVITDVVEPGVYDLGAVLDAGLTETQFQTLFEYAGFSTRAKSPAGKFDLIVDDAVLSLVYLPEPSAGVLLGLGILALYRRRVPHR